MQNKPPFTRRLGRRHAVNCRFKQLFNSHARDGRGLAWWHRSVWAAKAGSVLGRWKTEAVALRLPVSLRLNEAGALLHVDLGAAAPAQVARARSW